MKTSRNENNKQSKQGHVNNPRPDVRDTLDSRKEKEDTEAKQSYKPEKKQPRAKK